MGVYFRTFIARFPFDFVFCVPTVILKFMAFPGVINKFFFLLWYHFELTLCQFIKKKTHVRLILDLIVNNDVMILL